MEANKNAPKTVTCLGGPDRPPHPMINPEYIGSDRRVLYDGRCRFCCEQLIRQYVETGGTGPLAASTAKDWLTALLVSLADERKNLQDEMRYAAREPSYDEGYQDGQRAASREGW
jgi:hypothetical protein